MNISLSVNDGVADRFMWLLSHFKDDVSVIDGDFLRNKEELHKELADIKSEKTKMLTLEEFDKNLESVLSKYEG